MGAEEEPIGKTKRGNSRRSSVREKEGKRIHRERERERAVAARRRRGVKKGIAKSVREDAVGR